MIRTIVLGVAVVGLVCLADEVSATPKHVEVKATIEGKSRRIAAADPAEPGTATSAPSTGQRPEPSSTAISPLVVRVENATEFEQKSEWPVWIAIVMALVALATLAARTYFDWRGAQERYYAHLSNIWYDHKRQALEHPDWIDLSSQVSMAFGPDRCRPRNRLRTTRMRGCAGPWRKKPTGRSRASWAN